MVKMRVFKPITNQKYTRSASPDPTPSTLNRYGLLVVINQSVAGTYTAYTRPNGKQARLILAWQVQQNSGTNTTLFFDSQRFFFKSLIDTEYTQSPFVNLTYDTGLIINKDITMQITGAGTSNYAFVIIEEDLVSNRNF